MYWGEPVHMNLTTKPHKIQPCLKEKLCENSSRGNCFLRLCFVAPFFHKRQKISPQPPPFFQLFLPQMSAKQSFCLYCKAGRKIVTGVCSRRFAATGNDGRRRLPLHGRPHSFRGRPRTEGTFGCGKPCSPSVSRAGDERATARRAPYAVWGGGGNAGLRTGTRHCFSEKLRQKEGDSDRRTQGMISRSDILK